MVSTSRSLVWVRPEPLTVLPLTSTPTTVTSVMSWKSRTVSPLASRSLAEMKPLT